MSAETPYREHAAPPAVARTVECSWDVRSPDYLQGFSVMPDGCLDIIYTRDNGLQAIGAMTFERRFDLPAGTFWAGLRFQPGLAGSFFGVPASELTNRSVDLEDLLGRPARELKARLAESGPGELVRLLVAHPRIQGRILNPVQRAIEAITVARGRVGVDFVANQANLSPRQFRRRCLEESGLTPRLLCRILRFRHARQLAERAPRNWADIALAAGYYDQAHLIRDFREFTGRTPMSVFSNTGLPLVA
jgi:AraC-like DNA-binding protein